MSDLNTLITPDVIAEEWNKENQLDAYVIHAMAGRSVLLLDVLRSTDQATKIISDSDRIRLGMKVLSKRANLMPLREFIARTVDRWLLAAPVANQLVRAVSEVLRDKRTSRIDLIVVYNAFWTSVMWMAPIETHRAHIYHTARIAKMETITQDESAKIAMIIAREASSYAAFSAGDRVSAASRSTTELVHAQADARSAERTAQLADLINIIENYKAP